MLWYIFFTAFVRNLDATVTEYMYSDHALKRDLLHQSYAHPLVSVLRIVSYQCNLYSNIYSRANITFSGHICNDKSCLEKWHTWVAIPKVLNVAFQCMSTVMWPSHPCHNLSKVVLKSPIVLWNSELTSWSWVCVMAHFINDVCNYDSQENDFIQ